MFSGASARKKLVLVAANVLSIACLIWVLHDIDLAGLKDDLATMRWGWVALAAAADIAVYVWQGYRWSLLLKPIAPVSAWRSVRAIYVGLFANEVLPLRSGELIRCYLQGRWTGLPFSVVLSSALIERIFDGIWLMIWFYLTIAFVPLPGYLVDASLVLGTVLLVLAVLLSIVMFHKHHAHSVVSGRKWLHKLQVLVDDLHAIGNSRYFYWAGLASLPYLVLQVIPIWALFKAYELDLSIGPAAVVLVILRLGTVVPQAPGNLGTAQALIVVGLALFEIETGISKRFSLIMWTVITLPLLIAGFVALAITGMKLGDLRHRAEAQMPAESGVK